MPVRKFRSVEAMNETDWLSPDDPRLMRAIRTCWELAARLSPSHLTPGVHKFRSIEDLNAASDHARNRSLQRE